jgi:hypothetical protein
MYGENSGKRDILRANRAVWRLYMHFSDFSYSPKLPKANLMERLALGDANY